MRKLILASLLCLSSLSILNAQNDESSQKHFKNKDRQYNDWSIAVFGGGNILQNTDLVSFDKGYFYPGYDLQFQVNKQISHAFGLSLQYQLGKTKQKGTIDDRYLSGYSGKAFGKTEYQAITLLGDVNLSNLWRRVDNKSPFKWALHAYAGVGVLAYKAYRDNFKGSGSNYVLINEEELGFKSFYAQVGAGLRHKLNKRLDLELKGMYVLTGDEQFDGSGWPEPGHKTAADTNPGRDDNMFTLSLGVHYKFGKHDNALQWVAPSSGSTIINDVQPIFECIDEDGDGVCDQWDKCLGTPAGVKVDGSGCALDSDGDGIADFEDKCPFIPGPPTNGGCPEKVLVVSGEEVALLVTSAIEGVEFEYNSDKIREVSYPKLNKAVEVLLANPTYKFNVEGHTDAAGSAEYNQKLSERRAASVKRYLVNKGVNADNLVVIGKGKTDLKWPECNPVTNCPPWKNLENRRVIFKELK